MEKDKAEKLGEGPDQREPCGSLDYILVATGVTWFDLWFKKFTLATYRWALRGQERTQRHIRSHHSVPGKR